jgi:Catalytic LigB subunit of aromatic ring-opening dioxygenase
VGEILGLGISHYPPLAGSDEKMWGILKWTLGDPDIPESVKDPKNWPLPMQMEWGTDEGKTAAAGHRKTLVDGLMTVRAALDEFKPDFAVIWGDDQHENFGTDVIPPFCVLAYDDVRIKPWTMADGDIVDIVHTGQMGKSNVWNETSDFELTIRGHKQGAKFLASGLLTEGFDVAYAYRPLHVPHFGHAFLNSVLYMDYNRRGFDHPLVCFTSNCYGRRVLSQNGGLARLADNPPPEKLDPPSPSPRRCFDLGAATARLFRNSPYRVALIASSSWSHAFLNDKAWRIYPDVESDREFYEALRTGNYSKWRDTSLGELESAGQHEMLNWFCLVGAMSELQRKPSWSDFVESRLFNSSKCFSIFAP